MNKDDLNTTTEAIMEYFAITGPGSTVEGITRDMILGRLDAMEAVAYLDGQMAMAKWFVEHAEAIVLAKYYADHKAWGKFNAPINVHESIEAIQDNLYAQAALGSYVAESMPDENVADDQSGFFGFPTAWEIIRRVKEAMVGGVK